MNPEKSVREQQRNEPVRKAGVSPKSEPNREPMKEPKTEAVSLPDILIDQNKGASKERISSVQTLSSDDGNLLAQPKGALTSSFGSRSISRSSIGSILRNGHHREGRNSLEGVKFLSLVVAKHQADLKEAATNKAFSTNDETIKLFESMPKGFEYFIESGPPRIIQDYKDKTKLGEAHALQKEQLLHHDVPKQLRLNSLDTKRGFLQMVLKRFNMFVEDMSKKRSRADSHSKASKAAILELEIDIFSLNKKLERLRKKRDGMEKSVARFQKMDTFVENILAKTQFEHFVNLLDKYNALTTTNSLLMKRYMENMQRGEDMAEEKASLNDLAMQKKFFLRTELVRLTKRLEFLTTENIKNQIQLEVLSKSGDEKARTYYKMCMAIHNMAKQITNVRPTALKYFQGHTDPCELLDIIDRMIDTFDHIITHVSYSRTKIIGNSRSKSSRPV